MKKQHPLIEAWKTSDEELLTLLESSPERESPIFRAMMALRGVIIRKGNAKKALALAEKIPLEGLDSELCILFLLHWSNVSRLNSRVEETRVLLKRAHSLVSDHTSIEMQCYLMRYEGMLAGGEGRKHEREKSIRKILSIVPGESVHKKAYVHELVYFLAQQGRLDEVQEYFEWLVKKMDSPAERGWIAIIKFTHYVDTGQINEGFRMASEIEKYPVALNQLAFAMNFRLHLRILELMQAVQKSAFHVEIDPRKDDQPLVKNVYWNLLVRRTGEALQHARRDAERYDKIAGKNSYNLIRAELASGHGEAARRLLRRKQVLGNAHYFDDLFHARIEWLAGNQILARWHFSQVLQAVNKHQALGWLDFELRMACELSPGDLVMLSRRDPRAARKINGEAIEISPRQDLPTSEMSLVGNSAETLKLRKLLQHFAKLDTLVLIRGETGTGKELAARMMHDLGPRKAHPFIVINCGAIAESLLESELFGHKKGAFTGAEKAHRGLFEEAGEGTILLDEIGDIPLRLQIVLLRVLETREIRPVGSTTSRRINCRIMAATHADLETRVEEGQFRNDLLFRLRRLEVNIPMLKDRREDILPLVEYFLATGRHDSTRPDLSQELKNRLYFYNWPGNVRELRNTIERMRLMNSDKLHYDLDDFQIDHEVHAPGPILKSDSPVDVAGSETKSLDQAKALIDREITPLRRLDRLRRLFLTQKKLTRGEIIRIFSISPNTATSYLKQLCHEKTIEKIKPTASSRSHYFALKE